MATKWSLEKELCGLARVRTVPKALWRLGIISEPLSDVRIEEVQDWTRGGSEIYIYRFRVVQRAMVQDVVLKAIVAFSMAKSLTEIADEWLARRRLLESEGIRTPTLYCAKRAVCMERFIAHNLSDFLRTASNPPDHLILQVVHYAAVLDKLGFYPIEPFHSLRTDGVDIFAVDFGQDLGPPSPAPRYDGKMLKQAMRWLGACGQKIDKGRAASLYLHQGNVKGTG